MKIKCRNCGKPAAKNIQKVWVTWNYDYKTGNYSGSHKLLSNAKGPTGDENLHLCNSCFHKWKVDGL